MYQREIFMRVRVRIEAHSTVEADEFQYELRQDLLRVTKSQARQKRTRAKIIVEPSVQ